jgi:hypothetical protein
MARHLNVARHATNGNHRAMELGKRPYVFVLALAFTSI